MNALNKAQKISGPLLKKVEKNKMATRNKSASMTSDIFDQSATIQLLPLIREIILSARSLAARSVNTVQVSMNYAIKHGDSGLLQVQLRRIMGIPHHLAQCRYWGHEAEHTQSLPAWLAQNEMKLDIARCFWASFSR